MLCTFRQLSKLRVHKIKSVRWSVYVCVRVGACCVIWCVHGMCCLLGVLCVMCVYRCASVSVCLGVGV